MKSARFRFVKLFYSIVRRNRIRFEETVRSKTCKFVIFISGHRNFPRNTFCVRKLNTRRNHDFACIILKTFKRSQKTLFEQANENRNNTKTTPNIFKNNTTRRPVSFSKSCTLNARIIDFTRQKYLLSYSTGVKPENDCDDHHSGRSVDVISF